MDFIGGALPNVMFLIGIIAIGIGLGIEFKIVEIKGDLSRNGRIGAFSIGAILITISILLYLRPAQTAQAPTASPVPVPSAAPVGAIGSSPASPIPTDIPPTAIPASPTSAPPTAPPVTMMSVPDIRGQDLKHARESIEAAGLRFGEDKGNCATIGVAAGDVLQDAKRGRVMCQSVAPNASIPQRTVIDYVVRSKDN